MGYLDHLSSTSGQYILSGFPRLFLISNTYLTGALLDEEIVRELTLGLFSMKRSGTVERGDS